jgi:hypothetical protein
VATKARATPVYTETGSKRVFACALDWPGWARSAKTEGAAIEALADYASRYAPVAKRAGVTFPAKSVDAFDVVERLPGSATTDFGAPGAISHFDLKPTDRREARCIASILDASWSTLDEVVHDAPAVLRKGPRGGGRDRDAIATHVVEAELAYARKIGLRFRSPAPGDTAAIASLRAAIHEVVVAPSAGPPAVERGWPLRYAARRIAWHVLDHAWEIQDKS